MSKPFSILVRGHEVSNRTTRRYMAVVVRPEPVTTEHGTYVAFAHIEKRSDNLDTLRRVQRNFARRTGMFIVVVDTLTGKEI